MSGVSWDPTSSAWPDDVVALTERAGVACHDLVGWMMWDPDAIAAYESLGVPNGISRSRRTARRARPRTGNCGATTWVLCAAADLDDVEVGLLHSAMVDVDEYGSEEWIARSRGNDDQAIAAGWARLEAKGLAVAGALEGHHGAFVDRIDETAGPRWMPAVRVKPS